MPRTYLQVSFQQKDAAKALGARWDPSVSRWYVPEGMDVATFSPWLGAGSAVAGSSAALVQPVLTGLAAVEASAPELAVAKPRISLSSLLAGVASAVAAAYRSGVWTTVEVTEVKLSGRHVYLELSERDRNANLIAKARGTIWAETANRILPEFERATGATLAPGIKLLVRARPVFKPQFGLSVDIDAIDPEYTLGDLEARKREIRSRLRAEGVFENQKGLSAPWDFNAVLVVAPGGAAGLGDFQAEAGRLAAFGVCEFVYANSRFQGEGAAKEIAEVLVAALAQWNEQRGTRPDAVVIIRGGGSVNDLAWLNDYALARLVCEMGVPVLTGIGHERDSTVIDEVAHASFDTPSKVIAGIEQLIVRRAREGRSAYEFVIQTAQLAMHRARALVQRHDADVRQGATRQMELAERKSAEFFGIVREVSVETLHEAKALARDGVRILRQASLDAVKSARSSALALSDFVQERAQSHTLRVRVELDATHALVMQGAAQTLLDASSRSESLVREIAGQGPEKTLARGFAVVRAAQGQAIVRQASVTPGQLVTVQFLDGSVVAQVSKEIRR